MQKRYRLNRARGTLHIYGCCQYSRNQSFEEFDSEEEVDVSVGYHVPLCIPCRKRRDHMLEKVLLTRKGAKCK